MPISTVETTVTEEKILMLNNYVNNCGDFTLTNNSGSIFDETKPMIKATSLVALPMYDVNTNTINKLKWYHKLYATLLSTVMIAPLILAPPSVWFTVKDDKPLFYLTVGHVIVRFVDNIYILIITNFTNSSYAMKLFKKIDDIDKTLLKERAKYYKYVRIDIIIAIILPPIIFTFGFIMHKIGAGKDIQANTIVLHLILLITDVQASVMSYVGDILVTRHRMINYVILHKIKSNNPDTKYLFERDKLFSKAHFARKKGLNEFLDLDKDYSFDQLMKLYENISDGIKLFNDMYGVQVFIMIIGGFLSTLLIITRAASPTIEHSAYSLQDEIYWYICLNLRIPILAWLNSLFNKEKSNTRSMIVDIFVFNKMGEQHKNQIQVFLTQIDAYQHDVTAKDLYPMNFSTILSFIGVTTSYTVLYVDGYYHQTQNVLAGSTPDA